jgi:hypothetical protein
VGVARLHPAHQELGGHRLGRCRWQGLRLSRRDPLWRRVRERLGPNLDLAAALGDTDDQPDCLGAGGLENHEVALFEPRRAIRGRRTARWADGRGGGGARRRRRTGLKVGVGEALDVDGLEREARAGVGAHAPPAELRVPPDNRGLAVVERGATRQATQLHSLAGREGGRLRPVAAAHARAVRATTAAGVVAHDVHARDERCRG